VEVKQIIVLFLVAIMIIAFATFIKDSTLMILKFLVATVREIAIIVGVWLLLIFCIVIGFVSWIVLGIGKGIVVLINYCKKKIRRYKK